MDLSNIWCSLSTCVVSWATVGRKLRMSMRAPQMRWTKAAVQEPRQDAWGVLDMCYIAANKQIFRCEYGSIAWQPKYSSAYLKPSMSCLRYLASLLWLVLLGARQSTACWAPQPYSRACRRWWDSRTHQTRMLLHADHVSIPVNPSPLQCYRNRQTCQPCQLTEIAPLITVHVPCWFHSELGHVIHASHDSFRCLIEEITLLRKPEF